MRIMTYRHCRTSLVAGLLLGVVMLRVLHQPGEEVPPPPPTATPLPAHVKPQRPPPPTFDIVRASRFGTLVMAGRASPGALVTVLDGDVPVGSTKADRKGEWVVVPDGALSPGRHELYVRADSSDGYRNLNDEAVVLLIPERPDQNPVTLGGDGAGRVQHGTGLFIGSATRLGPDGLFLAGKGPTDALLVVYYDNLPVGEAIPDEYGRWRLAARLDIHSGRHSLRVDQVADGMVVASAGAILEIGLPKLVSMDVRINELLDFEDGIPILIEGGGRRLTGRTPGQGPAVRYR